MYPNQGYNNAYPPQEMGYSSNGYNTGMVNPNMGPVPMGAMSYGEGAYLNQPAQMGYQQPNQMGYQQPVPQNQVVYQQQSQQQPNEEKYWEKIPASSDPISDLTKAATVKISQRGNCCEVITCGLCECENIYDVIIEDSSNGKKHIFEMEEINGCCWKCCAPATCRSFQMDVKQVVEKDGKKSTTPFATFERPCKLGCLCFCEPEIYIKKGQNQLGKATMPCKCCGTELHIFNEKGDHKYTVKLGCCQCGFCCGPCCNVRGDIYEANTEVIVGVVSKECSCTRCCNKADDYHLNFPNNATVNEKLNLIAAVTLMDYRLFE